MLDALAEAVGGKHALEDLDDAPLPDQPFAWAAVPDDIRRPVSDVLAWCDRCCDELLDVEYRTACRRLLAAAAAGNPAVFRRRGRADTAAAAICWAIGRANDLFTPYAGAMLVKDLLAWFGISSPSVSQRGATLVRAAGFDGDRFTYHSVLGRELLVSSRRRRIMERRDRYVAFLAEEASRP